MRLRVLSFNVWGLPSPVGHRVGDRLALILRDFEALDCDIALFQEVWTDEGREQIVEGGRGLGYPHSFHPPGPARGGGGLLALSRLPLVRTHFRPFVLCGLPQRFTQMDYYSGKGLARVDVEVGGVPVAVFNTHLHARYAPARRVDAYRGHRTAEIIEIAEDLRREAGALVAVGDFNMRDTSPEHRVLSGLTGLVDAADALDAKLPTSTLENVYRLSRGAVSESRIDYVFCRDGSAHGIRPVACRRVYDATVEVAGEPGAHSDHAGVIADLEIGGPGGVSQPPTDDVFALAEVLLETGRDAARRRRVFERTGAGVSLAAGAGAIWAARLPHWSRRRFLRAGLGLGAAAAVGSAGGLLTLSEAFVPEEFEGYDTADTMLARLRATTRDPKASAT